MRKFDDKETDTSQDDDYSNGGTGGKSPIQVKKQIDIKIIIAFVLLVILALMGILKVHYGAILAVTAIEAVLVYLIHKEGYDNIQK